jgi:hypothetical protein
MSEDDKEEIKGEAATHGLGRARAWWEAEAAIWRCGEVVGGKPDARRR